MGGAALAVVRVRRFHCIECGRAVQTASGLYCQPACHLMHQRRVANARRARAARMHRDHVGRMKGRERRLLEREVE